MSLGALSAGQIYCLTLKPFISMGTFISSSSLAIATCCLNLLVLFTPVQLAILVQLIQVPKDFSFGLFELDWDAYGVHIENACVRIPQINETGIRSTVCGPGS